MNTIIKFITLGLLGLYIIYLFLLGKLNYLIHIRYIWLALAAGVIIALIGMIGLIINRKSLLDRSKLSIINLLMLLMVMAMFLVPLKSLSSDSFSLRAITQQVQLNSAEKEMITNKLNFNVDSTTFTMYDWIKAKGLGDTDWFVGKKFKGTGFISPVKDDKHFTLSRFIISCCVVDATPTGLIVEYDYTKTYKANDWLEVEGVFVVKDYAGVVQPVIIPTRVQVIPQPQDIYLNRN
jgi:putative membrane protein